MKFTLLRKDKSNVLHVSTRTLEQVFNRMAGARKLPACEVWPNVEMRKNIDRIPAPRHLNGVVVLTFEALSQTERREEVKEAAISLSFCRHSVVLSSLHNLLCLTRIGWV